VETALIFGSGGQDGFYLKELLDKKGFKTIGLSRNSGDIIGDVGDFSFVEKIIYDIKPNYIFHLAANSSTSHNALFDNHKAISTGTINILESVRNHSKHARVFLSGSAMQFKNNGNPIDESTPFNALSPYSVSRIHSVYAARYYRSKFNLNVYIGYLFNHDSPRRKENHVNQKIVEGVIRIVNGSKEILRIGNPNTRKEFNYAGDVVEAIWCLVNQTAVHEIVIGSGLALSIKEWLEYCFGKFNLNWKDHVEIDGSFVSEYELLVSNPALLFQLGWTPQVQPFELADMMLTSTQKRNL
jgi:GDPmannose 4,6-dehydratase